MVRNLVRRVEVIETAQLGLDAHIAAACLGREGGVMPQCSEQAAKQAIIE